MALSRMGTSGLGQRITRRSPASATATPVSSCRRPIQSLDDEHNIVLFEELENRRDLEAKRLRLDESRLELERARDEKHEQREKDRRNTELRRLALEERRIEMEKQERQKAAEERKAIVGVLSKLADRL